MMIISLSSINIPLFFNLAKGFDNFILLLIIWNMNRSIYNISKFFKLYLNW